GERRQPLGDRVDQAIADGVAERVVDALEVVEVKGGKATEAVLVARGNRFADRLMEVGAVGEAGEAVEPRHEADLLFGLDARRDILESDDAQFLAALARRKLEMLAVGKADKDLTIPALAPRPRQ